MDLLAPWFLAGGIAVGLPLWLHLLNRPNPVRLPFSSLMFFRKRTDSSVRERRLRYLLLLALRLALLTLLALAFAKPIWERPPAVLGARLPGLHIVAVDTSLSMQYGDRWSRALGEAEEIIGALERGDRAQILATGPAVRVVTEATGNREALRRALEGLVPTAARNSYGDVVEAVRNLVVGEDGPVELHLISDLQNTAMPARFQDLVLPPSVGLKIHDVAMEKAENWAIESVKGTTRLWNEERPQLEATVVSYSEQAAMKAVGLWIDGRPAGRVRLEIAPSGRTSFVFQVLDPPRAFSRAEFRLEPPDALPADDTRRVALDNTEPEPVLFVTPDPRRRDLLYFRAALEASAGMRYRLESSSLAQAGRLDPSRYALIVLSDVPRLTRDFESRLRAWLKTGGALLVALGPNSALARRSALTGHAVQQAPRAERRGDRFEVPGEADSSHPVARAAEGARSAKFFLYVHVEPQEGDLVPLRLGNGDPLLLEHTVGRGRVMLFASSLDNVWNDLPLRPVFVPFIAETARYLTGAESVRGESLLGDVLELGRRRGSGSSVHVADPSGNRVLTLSEAVLREAFVLEAVGFYEIRNGERSELVAVNPDPLESNLRPVEADTLQLWQSTGGSEAADTNVAGVAPPSPPWRIWRILLLLLVLAVLLESLVGNRHLDALRGD